MPPLSREFHLAGELSHLTRAITKNIKQHTNRSGWESLFLITIWENVYNSEQLITAILKNNFKFRKFTIGMLFLAHHYFLQLRSGVFVYRVTAAKRPPIQISINQPTFYN
ncbi:hypothetical protein PpSQ1_20805 [Pseudomonas putida]|nr:hypothetical protein PpSQ1_20805 [Pseudomonas putida]